MEENKGGDEAQQSGAFAEHVVRCPGFTFISHKPCGKRPLLKA